MMLLHFWVLVEIRSVGKKLFSSHFNYLFPCCFKREKIPSAPAATAAARATSRAAAAAATAAAAIAAAAATAAAAIAAARAAAAAAVTAAEARQRRRRHRHGRTARLDDALLPVLRDGCQRRQAGRFRQLIQRIGVADGPDVHRRQVG